MSKVRIKRRRKHIIDAGRGAEAADADYAARRISPLAALEGLENRSGFRRPSALPATKSASAEWMTYMGLDPGMIWRELYDKGQARLDYTLAGVAISAPAWAPSLADMTNFFVFLTAAGGFVLICFRIRRQWKHRNDPPDR